MSGSVVKATPRWWGIAAVAVLVVSLGASVVFAEITEPAQPKSKEAPKTQPEQNPPAPQPDPGAARFEVDDATTKAFERLKVATVFQGVYIGDGGDMSPNIKAFRVLWASPQAAALFRALSKEGTVVGRLYGAVGLYRFDPAQFEIAAESLRKIAKEDVEVHFGCMVGSFTVGFLLEPDLPAVRLEPGQTLAQWSEANKHPKTLDIVGGGYTGEFAGKHEVPRLAR